MAERRLPAKELAAAAALLALAGAYFLATRAIPDSSLSDAVGPRGLPHILAAVLAVLAVAIGAKALIARPRSRPEEEIAAEEARAPLPRALGFLAIGAGYMLLAPLVGYAIAIALLIAAVALYEGMQRGWRLAAVAACGGALFYLIFVALLGTEQPASFLFPR